MYFMNIHQTCRLSYEYALYFIDPPLKISIFANDLTCYSNPPLNAAK